MKKTVRNVVLALALAALVAPTGLHPAAAQDKKEQPKGATTFELYKDNSGEFRFRLKDGDDNLLAASGKGYKTKAECQKVIDAIKRDAAKAKVEDQTK